MSVFESALEIYEDAKSNADKILGSTECTYTFPNLMFKSETAEAKVKKEKGVVSINYESKKPSNRFYTHEFARFLLENVPNDEATITLAIPDLWRYGLDIKSSKVYDLEGLPSTGSSECGLLFKKYNYHLSLPERNAELMDTALFVLTGKKPSLKNFQPTKIFEGHEAKAAIKELPSLPSYSEQYARTAPAQIDKEQVILSIEEKRKARKEKKESLKKKFLDMGVEISEFSCERKEAEFWKNNGSRFSGFIGEEGSKQLLSSASFSYEPKDIKDIIRQLNLNFSEAVSLTRKEYLQAKSLWDLMDKKLEKDDFYVNYNGFKIKKSRIEGDKLSKRKIEDMLAVAEKIIPL